MSSAKHVREELLSLYQAKRLVTDSDSGQKAQPLHENCAMAPTCWSNASDRIPKADSDNNRLSLPWIGANYDSHHILVLGENFNECGGLNACSYLVETAIREMIEKGTKRVFSGGKTEEGKIYRGTFFYYKMACYCKVLIHALGQTITDTGSLRLNEANQVADSLHSISYTNQVKCSPSYDLSRPEEAMWQQCGRHILSEEIAILAPKWIIVLGKGNNANYFMQLVCNPEIRVDGIISAVTGQLNGCQVNIIVLPHPSYFRYKVAEVAASLLGAVKALVDATKV